jgi:cell division protein FtsQ
MSKLGSVRVGPDQRYWRRRANRRVRKARRNVNLLRWSLILGVNGIVIAALLFSAQWTVDYLTTTDEFAVRRIELSGLHHASPDLIRARLHEQIEGNILDLDLTRIEETVQSDRWVRSATVRRVLPDTLYVRIVERTPIALARIDDRVYLVDSTGYIIGPAGAGIGESLPLLGGLQTDEPAVLRRTLRRGVAVLERLQAASPAFARGISRIDLSREDRIAVARTSGGPSILLDPDRVEQNLLYFMELRPAIERRVGSAAYIDLRWRDRISVMPANHSTQGRTR